MSTHEKHFAARAVNSHSGFAFGFATGFLLLVAWTGVPQVLAEEGLASPRIAPNAKPLSMVQRVLLPSVDNQALLEQSQIEEQQRKGPGPLLFAKAMKVDIQPENSGTWETLPDGTRLWRVRIASLGAHSLSLYLSHYAMPPGGKLTLYSPDYRVIIGPFTELDNKKHGKLWTPLVPGEEIVVEVSIPAAYQMQLVLTISGVNHGYRSLDPPQPTKSWPQSGLPQSALSTQAFPDQYQCFIDEACPEADPYRIQSSSVVKLIINGNAACSGGLVNNRKQDGKPFILSAWHCFGDLIEDMKKADPGLLTPEDELARQLAYSVVVYWRATAPYCRVAGTIPDNDPRETAMHSEGASMRAHYPLSDMLLLELDAGWSRQPFFNDQKIYFAGWDARDLRDSSGNVGAQTAFSIHHPLASYQRISIENNPPTLVNNLTAQFCDFDDTLRPVVQSNFIQVDWDQGRTDHGSSGAPLFNDHGDIIGQLYGGNSECINNGAGGWFSRFICPDVFGWLPVSWAGNGTSAGGLQPWLDPDNTNNRLLPGAELTVNPSHCTLYPDDCIVVGGTTSQASAIRIAWTEVPGCKVASQTLLLAYVKVSGKKTFSEPFPDIPELSFLKDKSIGWINDSRNKSTWARIYNVTLQGYETETYVFRFFNLQGRDLNGTPTYCPASPDNATVTVQVPGPEPSPIPMDLQLSSQFITGPSPVVFEASNSITAGIDGFTIAEGASVWFRINNRNGAGIFLKPGFTAKAGSFFHAFIPGNSN